MIDENHPFQDSIYGDTRKRAIETILPNDVSLYFLITPRRFEVDERYASLLRSGDIVLEHVFREVIALEREPSPQCQWLYKVISCKVKREHHVDLATFDKNRFDYNSLCFDDYDDLAAYLSANLNEQDFQMKMEWETNIPSC